MKWSESKAVKLLINNVQNLDPITVYIENYNLGQGKVTITISGQSWSSYWGAMGNRNLEQFVLSCDNHYLSKNLATLSELSEPDYDGFIDNIRSEIIEYRRSGEHSEERARELWELTKDVEPDEDYFNGEFNLDLLHEIGGCEWYQYIPSKDSDLFNYLCLILDAVKECLKDRQLNELNKGDNNELHNNN